MHGLSFSERELRRLPKPPRLHPLGFIQLELDGLNRRLHVFPQRRLPVQGNRTKWHDHVFGIQSTVIAGALRNDVLDAVPHPNGAYRMLYVNPYSATGKESQFRFGPPDERFEMQVTESRVIRAGETYVLEPFRFHVSEPVGFAATVMTMTSIDREAVARVVTFLDAPMPTMWDRNIIPVEELWDEIRKVCA